jgi:hypothetical protein
VIQHVRAENSRLQEELQVLRTPREQELLGIARERTAAVHRISDVVTLAACADRLEARRCGQWAAAARG